ncbi:hypothetical protein BDZ89DRAFT_1036543 [Hymenopellis radicata]|nr:hypothetical protein BDZ89DRAFT_1036543 [Hymenopellis radicata]
MSVQTHVQIWTWVIGVNGTFNCSAIDPLEYRSRDGADIKVCSSEQLLSRICKSMREVEINVVRYQIKSTAGGLRQPVCLPESEGKVKRSCFKMKHRSGKRRISGVGVRGHIQCNRRHGSGMSAHEHSHPEPDAIPVPGASGMGNPQFYPWV